MKHVSVLVPKGDAIVDTIVGTYGQLRMANAYHRRSKGADRDLLEIDLVGIDRTPVIYNRYFQVSPNKTIKEIQKTDLIIVTAISGDLEKGIDANRGFVSWIKKQRIEHGAEIASLCKGALLLAETGLLNEKSCATHWTAHEIFRRKYPKVHLQPDKVICEDNGIFSSGGAYSFLNFMIYLVERNFGRETALWCSKVSEIDFDRDDQSPFMIFNGQKDHHDESIRKAQIYVEEHFTEKINLDRVAEMFMMSKRTFLRRFKKATSNTPLEYIQRVKTEAAKKKLESSTMNIHEVMYLVGYKDEKAFRNIFRKYTGLSPLDYRKKYNREMAMA
jgi:transcriptional regulator GlxA family with amidase domain